MGFIVSIEKEKFPKSFWIANVAELFERAAFYGMFIFLTIYLTQTIGFSDIWAGIIGAFFATGIYILPMFTGAYSDKIGFRNALILAFICLTVGYFTLGILHTKMTTVLALLILMFGGSFIKSVITGTVAKSSTIENRARAYSIFYSMVNVGSFSGKLFAEPIRAGIDIDAINLHFPGFGVEFIGVYSAVLSFIALIAVIFYFKDIDTEGVGKTMKELLAGFKKLFAQPRLWVLILIISGFWLVQHQMYASMPKYIIRMVGEHATPAWYANVNPAIIMIFVLLVTRWMQRKPIILSMSIGMIIMPVSALVMSTGPYLETLFGNSVSLGFFSLHPVALAMVIGIGIQGFAECFISPRFLEYFSLQAPRGEEGLYLGFAHLHSSVANFVGFFISGFLLDAYCPNPERADLVGLTPEQLAPYYAGAANIWYVYAAIVAASAVALLIYDRVLKRIDARKTD